MQKKIIFKLRKSFEDSAHIQDEIEYWLARDLQKLLDYDEWRNFLKVVEKAKLACLNSNQPTSYHFVDANKTIEMPKGAAKEIEDIMLTRYACYLVAQNGDPRKDTIAFAQSYFALQTRKQELLEKRIALVERIHARAKLAHTEKELSGIIYDRGVDGEGFARLRSKGDQVLFGGFTTMEMKKKLNVPAKRPLADFLPIITIKAKDLATEITAFNTKRNNLRGEQPITGEHIKNNKDVRQLLGRSGIKPEALPAETDVKKIGRQIKSEGKRIVKHTPSSRKSLKNLKFA